MNALFRLTKKSTKGLLIASALLLASELRADPEVEYLGRLGLFSSPEFTGMGGTQYSVASILTESGYVSGYSNRYNGSNDAGRASWVSDVQSGTTKRVGLFSGAEFTATDGNQDSEALSLTESGYVIGLSNRYNGSNYAGQAAWFTEVGSDTTKRVGFFSGAEFTRTDSYQYSSAESLTESGYISGRSSRYNGSSNMGYATWVYDVESGTTKRVGFFSEAEFTRADGYQNSSADSLTESGYISGSSSRHNGSSDIGYAAWVSDVESGTTKRVGLFSGTEFTRADGYQRSSAERLTESGYVYGRSARYNGYYGSSDAGQAAWVSDVQSGTTKRVGFFSGSEFTRADGYQYSSAESLTESGYVSGYSDRYNGLSAAGRAAWVTKVGSAATKRLGLFSGAEFTATNGTQYSLASDLTESGYIHGTSVRYNGSTDAGYAAWVSDVEGGTTKRVGLFSGTEFTRTDGYQSSYSQSLTESGYVRGSSHRYNGSSDAGDAAWVSDVESGTTKRVGLFSGTEFTRTDGYQSSYAHGLTESGYVYGTSARYNGFSDAGRTAWIFNITSDEMFTFNLSSRPSDGYSYSLILGITNDGFAYGFYTLFDNETNLGNRAFIWSADFGTILLSEEILGGIEQYGWSAFTTVQFMNSNGIAIGEGTMSENSGQGIYAVQAVPEPSSLLLLLLGLSAFTAAARRR